MGLKCLQTRAGRLTCGSAGSRGRGICSGTAPARAPKSGKEKRRFTASLRLWEPKQREFLSLMTSLIRIFSGTAWGERDERKKQAPALVGLTPSPRWLGWWWRLDVHSKRHFWAYGPVERTAGNEEITDVEWVMTVWVMWLNQNIWAKNGLKGPTMKLG